MAKIDMAKELVENHAPEEVVAWLDEGLDKMLRTYSQLSPEMDDRVLLGQITTNLSLLLSVTKRLSAKMNRKQDQGPVVA